MGLLTAKVNEIKQAPLSLSLSLRNPVGTHAAPRPFHNVENVRAALGPL